MVVIRKPTESSKRTVVALWQIVAGAVPVNEIGDKYCDCLRSLKRLQIVLPNKKAKTVLCSVIKHARK